MRRILQLAAALLLTATARAQITNPDALIAPPPRPPAQNARAADLIDVQWMWHYTQPAPLGDEPGLIRDARFAALLRDAFQAPQSFWRGGAVPLAQAALQHFGVTQGGVQSEGNRYLWLTGCVAHNCPDQGLLWADTLPGHNLLIFAATDWTTQTRPIEDPDAGFNLWIFPDRPLERGTLPEAFRRTVLRWNHPGHIAAAFLIAPDGTPFTLDPTLQTQNP